MKTLLTKWFGRKEQPIGREIRKPSRTRLQVEALEARDMPTWSPWTYELTYRPVVTSELQADGTLQINGTNQSDGVRLDASQRTFFDFNTLRWRSEFTVTVSINFGQTNVYDGYRVAKVVFDGKDGDDVLTIGHEAYDWPSLVRGHLSWYIWPEPFFPIPVHAAGGMGSDWLEGGSANDILQGDPDDPATDAYGWSLPSADYLWGNGGNDNLYGMGSADALYGGTGTDYLDGGNGDDWIYGDVGNDGIKGGGGSDHLYGEEGIDFIWGGEGADTIHGGSSYDLIWGEGGDDYIYGEGGSDYLLGGEGFDRLWGGDGNDFLDPGRDGVAGEWAFGEAGLDQFANIEREWWYSERYRYWKLVRQDWTDCYHDEYYYWNGADWIIVRDSISYVDITVYGSFEYR